MFIKLFMFCNIIRWAQKSPAAFRRKPAGRGANSCLVHYDTILELWHERQVTEKPLVHHDTERCKKGIKNASQNGVVFPLKWGCITT